MTLSEIFSDVEEVIVADSKQIQSPFLTFLLNKNREFFITHSIVTISEHGFLPILILKGKKLINGGLEWSDHELRYTEESVLRIYYLWKKEAENNK